jgi:hypothetical protein
MPRLDTNGRVVLAFEDVVFECDPRRGGRITTFALDGINVLAGPEIDPNNFGSTFWTSPQSDWGWPPPSELDRQPYEYEFVGPSVVLTSQPSPELEVRLVKRFSIDANRRSTELVYAIENLGTAPRCFAPWEVSRVPPGGVSFFPSGKKRDGSGPFQPLVTREIDGITWYRHDAQSIEADQKLFADGAQGWMAHLGGDRLFIKTFSDISPQQQAPGEGEIEIYANRSYLEIEQQGAYTEIKPGEVSQWTVRWYLRKLPSGVDPTLGSPSLVAFVQEIVG